MACKNFHAEIQIMYEIEQTITHTYTADETQKSSWHHVA